MGPAAAAQSPSGRSRHRSRGERVGLRVGALALLAGACGDGAPTMDAMAAASTESAEISIRFDVSAGKPTTAEVLAFRATTATTTTTATAFAGPTVGALPDWQPDVLGIVDPLAAEAPDQGCALRDLDLATKTLALRGGSIDLQEMTGIGVGMGAAAPSAGLGGEKLLRPFPRLYPDVATVVGGVVAESGPEDVGALPDRITLYSSESELPVVELGVPTAPRVVAINGAAIAPGLRVDARDGLAVTVAGAAGGQIELRPFGATVASTCTIPANATGEAVVALPRAFVAHLLAHLQPAAGAAPGAPFAVSLEVVRRAHLRQGLAGADARVSVEVRSATTVELRP
jgi:hypothetical protein